MVIVLAYALHRWIGIRRDVLGDRWTDVADSFWARTWAWIKKRWDFAVALVIAVAPVVWSTGLDIIVIAANMLAGVLPAVAGIDLSALMISDTHKAYIQLGAALLPPLRDAYEKVRG